MVMWVSVVLFVDEVEMATRCSADSPDPLQIGRVACDWSSIWTLDDMSKSAAVRL